MIWIVAAPAIATINTQGVLTAGAALGMATVTATLLGTGQTMSREVGITLDLEMVGLYLFTTQY